MNRFVRNTLFALACLSTSSVVAQEESDDTPSFSPLKGKVGQLPNLREKRFNPSTRLEKLDQARSKLDNRRREALSRNKVMLKQAPDLDEDEKARAFEDLGKNSSSKVPKSSAKPMPKAGDSASKGNDGSDEARWRQVEDNDKPTLSADFIKNCAQLKPGMKVHLDIYDEEIEAVVKLIACMTGENIILAKPLKGKKITIYSPTMVTAAEAYKAFLTALESNGLTISRQGKFLRVIEIKDFIRKPDPILGDGERAPNEDRMVTQIINLENVDAQEISEVLSKLSSTNAQFIVYQPTNSLIVTEVAANLERLKNLIKRLDVPGGQEQLWTYQVVHANASDIAQKITEIFDQDTSGKHAPPRPGSKATPKGDNKAPAATNATVGESDLDVKVGKVIADERTNRLLIIATARSYRRVKSLISQLDVEIPGDGQVHIHQLNHAKATEVSQVLSNLSNEQKSRQNQSGNQNRKGSSNNSNKGGNKSSTPATGSNSAALFEGEVSVTADEDTNALVITASLKDYLSLKKVIEVLDRPRRQVFIEAVVMEVAINNSRDLGISLHGGVPGPTVSGENTNFLVANQPGKTKSYDLTSAVSLTGLAAALSTEKTIEIAGISLPKFGVILNALASSSDTNILSTPHILTTDNQEAEIVVGSNVPFVSGYTSYATTAAAYSSYYPTVNVQRQDVALTLKITPRINAANFVTMEIDQVIEDIESTDAQLGPTTSKRSIKSTVEVKDQNTVVIGGLQRTSHRNGRSAVPFLGEIPVIGYFFRESTKDLERRNLLLLLTPHVIESPADFAAIFDRKMEEHREFVARFHKEGDELVLGIDYAKKHGPFEAIRQSIKSSRTEAQLLEELRQMDQGQPLPQDLDGVSIEPAPAQTTQKSAKPEPQKSAVDADEIRAAWLSLEEVNNAIEMPASNSTQVVENEEELSAPEMDGQNQKAVSRADGHENGDLDDSEEAAL